MLRKASLILIILLSSFGIIAVHSCRDERLLPIPKPKKEPDLGPGPKFRIGTDSLSMFRDTTGRLVKVGTYDRFDMIYSKAIGDTICYSFDYEPISDGWSTYDELNLKVIGEKIYLKHARVDFGENPQVLLIDLKDRVGVRRNIANYFMLKDTQISLKEKGYDKHLDDTVYNYTITGKNFFSHYEPISGFVYTGKLGFISFYYDLEGYCRTYTVLKEFENLFVDSYEKGER
jgi:hypothetical protein